MEGESCESGLIRAGSASVRRTLTGLDVQKRSRMLNFFHFLHTSDDTSTPHIILGMRFKDGLLGWITHVAFVTTD
ncbi:uncharacterized protein FIBRA_08428 [Fibroporia radiculosa]|uniref:Uncharacterized protein n=1 Tax=Fibroporia radiculosa TaxID=599839 RepID=J4ICC8_9APHY|nr:uncharacterized protein FIBRA_08428 [Fibroporia radiculosa]CCM06186.1 predicted protein [Fibroporia radiculosa]